LPSTPGSWRWKRPLRRPRELIPPHGTTAWYKSLVGGQRHPLFDGFSGDLLFSPEIVVVSLDFQRIIRERATQQAEVLFQLSPRQFEEFIAEVWDRLGYQVELTKRTRDGGRDIVAVKQAEVSTRYLIECKRYDPNHKISVGVVRELYGVKVHEKATKGILATTSYFSPDALEFVDEHFWELEARDHEGVVKWVKSVVKLP
jgi:restriction system protein